MTNPEDEGKGISKLLNELKAALDEHDRLTGKLEWPIKRKIDEAKKETLEQERAADGPLAEAETFLKGQSSEIRRNHGSRVVN